MSYSSGESIALVGKTAPIIKRVDVLVCGGGVAGFGAAIAAAREGSRTLLIEQQGFLGGALSASGMAQWGIGIPKMSGLAQEVRDRLVDAGRAFGERVLAIDPEGFKDTSFEMCEEAGVELILFTSIVDVVMEGENVRGVVIHTKDGPRVILAKVIVDATGDADVCALAGVPYVTGREHDGKMRPISLLFRVGNIELGAVAKYIDDNPHDFLRDPGRHLVDLPGKQMRVVGFFSAARRARERGELDADCHYVRLEDVLVDRGIAMVNTTRVYDVSGLDPRDLTRAMTAGRKQLHQILNFLVSYIPGFENAFLIDSAPALGVRETRRIRGEHLLTEDDIATDQDFHDVIFRTHMRHMPGREVHSPDAGEGSAEDLTHTVEVMPITSFDVPYRALVPLKVNGLLAAGRCISMTQEADRWLRNQPQAMLTGQAAGIAAAISAANGTNPREVNVKQLQDALREREVEVPSRIGH